MSEPQAEVAVICVLPVLIGSALFFGMVIPAYFYHLIIPELWQSWNDSWISVLMMILFWVVPSLICKLLPSKWTHPDYSYFRGEIEDYERQQREE